MKIQKSETVSVLFMVPSPPGISPGQRFRFEHYLPMLEEFGIKYKISPFLTMKGRNALYSNGHFLQKALAMACGLFRRTVDLFHVWQYDYVYIHRWASIAGPPVAEWIIAKVFRKKIIYDFDDAIWVKESPYNGKYLSIKFLGKISKICRWAHKITVGNSFLAAYALKYNKSVIVIPTVVNTATVHGEIQNQETLHPAVGWTGTFSTLRYLDIILPILQRLQEKIDFTFYVIADIDPVLPLKNYKFIPWNKHTETTDLLHFHIGIMPLTNDDVSRGKCGFKAIQYMAMGMPALVSPVGINTEIVDDGVNGYICHTDNDWEEKLLLMLQSRSLRNKIGAAARKKIVDKYSVTSTKEIFLGLFKVVFFGFFLNQEVCRFF